ncbi:response regulator [Paraneptunicella aestuarii]|uniref:ATP-binding protein n=1 Tax=Paraneptunicella aestuarii TaxID=2831148 RepID=UPI001E40946B|nr:ATP-binding protein [Paraneptunicella aestuarii]UAA38259.1 response regulator [Paraneptunicella aestuarii]
MGKINSFKIVSAIALLVFLMAVISIIELLIMHFLPLLEAAFPELPASYLDAIVLSISITPILVLLLKSKSSETIINSDSIQRKIYFASGLPLLIAIGLLLYSIDLKRRDIQALTHTDVLIQVNDSTQKLLNTLSKELQASSLKLHSNLKQSSLKEMQENTNQQLQNWIELIAKLKKGAKPEAFNNKYYNQLLELRQSVLIGASWPDIVRQYSTITSQILNEIAHNTSLQPYGNIELIQSQLVQVFKLNLLNDMTYTVLNAEQFRKQASPTSPNRTPIDEELQELKSIIQKDIEYEQLIIDNLYTVATPQQTAYLDDLLANSTMQKVHQLQLTHSKRSNALLISRLQTYIGYNGLIHQFKNYILRGDEKYVQTFQAYYKETLTILGKLEKAQYADEHYHMHLKAIRAVLEEYAEKIPLVTQMHNQNATVVTIDRTVKVDDIPAIGGLQYLNNFIWEFSLPPTLELLQQKSAILDSAEHYYGKLLAEHINTLVDAKNSDIYAYSAIALILLIAVIFLVIMVNLDLSTAYQARLEAVRQAQKANSMKDIFLSNMSHEIRTPINGIFGTLQILSKSPQTSANQTLISKALLSARSLSTIINDILDFAKIEANMLSLENIQFEISEIAHLVISDLDNKATRKGIKLELNFAEGFKDGWVGDPTRIHQILLNLVSNAVKFTKRGNVEITIGNTIDDSVPCLYIKVADTGVGMSEEAILRLFDRFEQADKSTTREFGGTGLGMAITKSLVDMMQGRIEVISTANVGTTIEVFLPLEQTSISHSIAEMNAKEEVEPPSLKGTKILLAEDNEINQVVFESMMGPTHADLRLVANGQDAIKLVSQNKPDLIFLDIQMPIMGGEEACERIKVLYPDIPIIALTANVMQEDVKRYYETGFDDFIPKPVDMNLLYRVLIKYLREQGKHSLAS